MLIKFKDKLKCNRGSDKGILLTGLIVGFILVFSMILIRSNAMFSRHLNNFKVGLQTGSKAALLQVDENLEKNIENIATGFIIEGENAQKSFNHELKLNHTYSNRVALKLLSSKTGFSLDELKPFYKTTIIEPEREEGTINNYRLRATYYNMNTMGSNSKLTPYFDFTNDAAVKNQFTEIENWINLLLSSEGSNMRIKLTTIETGFSRQMEVKTYFLSLIDGFNPYPQTNELYNNENKLINIYYFEGVNLMRSTNFRDKQ